MKLFFLLLSCTFLFISCSEKEKMPIDEAVKYNSGTSDAYVNGNVYKSSITRAAKQADKGGLVTISMDLYKNGLLKQSIVLFDVPTILGAYKVVSSMQYIGADKYIQRKDDSCKAYFFLSDEDAIENTYYVFEAASDNYLEVEKYDASKALISGKFNLTLYRERPKEKPQTQGFHDTLRITDGKFEVIIK